MEPSYHRSTGRQWRKSSFCNADQPMCVEVNGEVDGHILLRDSNGTVCYTQEEFAVFIEGVKAGNFDDMV